MYVLMEARRQMSPVRASDWTFELARSLDMVGIGELTSARPRSMTRTLNKAGSFTCSVSLDEVIAEKVLEVETCVVVSFAGEKVWSGPVWTCSETIDSGRGSLTIGCVGWLQTLDKRITRPVWGGGGPKTWTLTDAGEIAQDMLAITNDDAAAAGAPSYVFPGSWETTQQRTRTYQPWSVVLANFTELCEIEGGFDMEVDPTTRNLNIYSLIQKNNGVTFDLDRNLQSISRQTDAGRTINYLNAYSSIGNYSVVDADSLAELGLFEEARSLSDVVNPDILQAYAAGEVFVYRRPLPILSFAPKPYSEEFPDYPRPFRDYDIGDIVVLNAHRGRMNLDNVACRIFSYTLEFQDNGDERVTDVQVTAQ